MKLNDIFKEFFDLRTNANIFVIPDNSLGILFQNKIPDLLKTEFDEAQLLDKYVEQFVNAINAAGPGYIPVYKPVGSGYRLGEPEYTINNQEDKIKTIKTILEWYITRKTIPENEQGKKVFSVLEKVKNEKFGTEGEHLNLQAAYSPVIAKFNIVIANVLKKLQKQIAADPVNKGELEAYKDEVTEYDKVIKNIATVINSQTSDQFSSQWQQLQNIEESKDAITSNVDNVLNLSSDARKVIGVEKADIKDIDTIGKIISMQLRLIGGRMDIITGKKKKGIADADVKASLAEKDIDIDGGEYDRAKEKFGELTPEDKGAYATGLLGYIQDLFKVGSKAFKELFASPDNADKDLLDTIISAKFGQQIAALEDSLDEAGYTVKSTDADSLRKLVVTQLVKKTSEQDKNIIFKSNDDKYLPLKRGRGTYTAVPWRSYEDIIYIELKRNNRTKNALNNRAPELEETVTQLYDMLYAPSDTRPADSTPKTDKVKSFFKLGDQEGKMKQLFSNIVARHRSSMSPLEAVEESKQRKTIQNLIQLIEQEMNKPKEKTLEQKLVKKLAPLVEQTFKRKQHG